MRIRLPQVVGDDVAVRELAAMDSKLTRQLVGQLIPAGVAVVSRGNREAPQSARHGAVWPSS
jgi:hypothetical protein